MAFNRSNKYDLPSISSVLSGTTLLSPRLKNNFKAAAAAAGSGKRMPPHCYNCGYDLQRVVDFTNARLPRGGLGLQLSDVKFCTACGSSQTTDLLIDSSSHNADVADLTGSPVSPVLTGKKDEYHQFLANMAVTTPPPPAPDFTGGNNGKTGGKSFTTALTKQGKESSFGSVFTGTTEKMSSTETSKSEGTGNNNNTNNGNGNGNGSKFKENFNTIANRPQTPLDFATSSSSFANNRARANTNAKPLPAPPVTPIHGKNSSRPVERRNTEPYLPSPTPNGRFASTLRAVNATPESSPEAVKTVNNSNNGGPVNVTIEYENITVGVEVVASMTVADLKKHVSEVTGWDVCEQVIFYDGTRLDGGDLTLAELDVEEGGVFYMQKSADA